MTNSILDNAKNHFNEQLANDLLSFEVKEWNATIYYRPAMSFKEQSKIMELQQANKFSEALVETIITKAMDKDGNKVFSPADRVTLMNEADPNVVVRVAASLNGVNLPMEQVEGN